MCACPARGKCSINYHYIIIASIDITYEGQEIVITAICSKAAQTACHCLLLEDYPSTLTDEGLGQGSSQKLWVLESVVKSQTLTYADCFNPKKDVSKYFTNRKFEFCLKTKCILEIVGHENDRSS